MEIPGNYREFPGFIFHSRGTRPGKTGKTRQLQWTRQTRFVLWAGSGQAYAPGACPTVLSYPSTRQSHWKCLSGFGEAPARLPVDLPDFREFPPGVAIPGNSREFPTPETLLPGNWPTIVYIKVCLKSLNNILTDILISKAIKLLQHKVGRSIPATAASKARHKPGTMRLLRHTGPRAYRFCLDARALVGSTRPARRTTR